MRLTIAVSLALSFALGGCKGGGSDPKDETDIPSDDTDDSDLDILVEPTKQTTLIDIAAIQYELKQLLGISVDVLTPNALPDAFRKQVIEQAQPV